MKRGKMYLALLLLVAMLSGCASTATAPLPKEGVQSTANATENIVPEETPTTPNTSGVILNGSVISWANMKIDNPNLTLTDEQKEVVSYFDEDYFYVSDYDNLQRYPKIYRNSQISFHGFVTKVLNADDDSYECLFSMSWPDSWDEELVRASQESLETKSNLMIIKGSQGMERIIAGDALKCAGRYIDVQPYEIDGTSYLIPVVTINYTIKEGSPEYPGERFDFNAINRISKTIFGSNIKLHEPILGEDFELDDLHIPQDTFYVVVLDDQSNSNFSKFEVHDRIPYIRSSDSTPEQIRTFDVAADFEHYIISVYNPGLKLLYLEYYDKLHQKLWSREFQNVDTIPFDYTADNIYLAVDTELFIIDTETGEDAIDPVIVGQKTDVIITEDGAILIGKGTKDNIMKVDQNGKVLWKTSADLDVTYSGVLQLVNGNVVVQLNNTKERESEYYEGTEIYYTKDITVAVDENGSILTEFVDSEYNLDDYR